MFPQLGGSWFQLERGESDCLQSRRSEEVIFNHATSRFAPFSRSARGRGDTHITARVTGLMFGSQLDASSRPAELLLAALLAG